MTQWTVISKSQHAQARYYPRQGYAHAREQLVAAVLLAELPRLIPHFVLGFIAQEDALRAVALLGLETGRNLYVHPDGRWLGSYVPASLRGYPFNLLPDEQGQHVLCIDADRLTDDPAAGEPLFQENGEASEAVSRQLEFQRQCRGDGQRTRQAVDALQKAGVIQPWSLSIPRGTEKAPKTIEGLHRIDEHKLNTLDAEAYARLQGAPMALAHAHLFSVYQQSQLTERAKYHAEAVPRKTQEGLSGFLVGDGEDDAPFDFDNL